MKAKYAKLLDPAAWNDRPDLKRELAASRKRRPALAQQEAAVAQFVKNARRGKMAVPGH